MSDEHTVTNDSQLKIADEEIARLRKQLDEWKAAHDNLARQLSVTNDSLEIAVEGLVGIYNQHEHIDNKYAQGAAKMASEALKRLNVQG